MRYFSRNSAQIRPIPTSASTARPVHAYYPGLLAHYSLHRGCGALSGRLFCRAAGHAEEAQKTLRLKEFCFLQVSSDGGWKPTLASDAHHFSTTVTPEPRRCDRKPWARRASF